MDNSINPINFAYQTYDSAVQINADQKTEEVQIFPTENLYEQTDDIFELSDEFDICEKLEEPVEAKSDIVQKTGIEATLDGKIGDTRQQSLGDCWLLASVNAISSSETGKQLIKDVLQYDENGVNVYIKGIDKSYYFTNESLITAQNSGLYSQGDLDMNAIELAIQEAFIDICKGEAKLPENIIDAVDNEHIYPFAIHNTGGPGNLENIGNEVLNGNSEQYAFYLLTGNLPYQYNGNFENTIDALYAFEDNNSQNKVMTASIEDGRNIETKDINGLDINLPSDHVYTIKNVKKGDNGINDTEITILNPHNSGAEITMKTSEFMGIFDWFTCTDLQ